MVSENRNDKREGSESGTRKMAEMSDSESKQQEYNGNNNKSGKLKASSAKVPFFLSEREAKPPSGLRRGLEDCEHSQPA